MNPYEWYQQRRLEHQGDEPFDVHLPHAVLEHAPTAVGLYKAVSTMHQGKWSPAAVPAATINGIAAGAAVKTMSNMLREDLTHGDEHQHKLVQKAYHLPVIGPMSNDPSHPVEHALANAIIGAGALGAIGLARGTAHHLVGTQIIPRVIDLAEKTVPADLAPAAAPLIGQFRQLTALQAPYLKSPVVRSAVLGGVGLGLASGAARAWGQHHRHHDPRPAHRANKEAEMDRQLQELYGLEHEHDGTVHPDWRREEKAAALVNPFEAFATKLAYSFGNPGDHGDESVERHPDGSWSINRAIEGVPMTGHSRRVLERKWGPDWEHMAPYHELAHHGFVGLATHHTHGHHDLDEAPEPGTKYDVSVEGIYGDHASYGKTPHRALELVDEALQEDGGEGLVTHHKITFPADHPIAKKAEELWKQFGGQEHEHVVVHPAHEAAHIGRGMALGGIGGMVAGGALGAKALGEFGIIPGAYAGGLAGVIGGAAVGSRFKYTVPERRTTHTEVFDEDRAMSHARGELHPSDLDKFQRKTAALASPFEVFLQEQLEKDAALDLAALSSKTKAMLGAVRSSAVGKAQAVKGKIQGAMQAAKGEAAHAAPAAEAPAAAAAPAAEHAAPAAEAAPQAEAAHPFRDKVKAVGEAAGVNKGMAIAAGTGAAVGGATNAAFGDRNQGVGERFVRGAVVGGIGGVAGHVGTNATAYGMSRASRMAHAQAVPEMTRVEAGVSGAAGGLIQNHLSHGKKEASVEGYIEDLGNAAGEIDALKNRLAASLDQTRRISHVARLGIPAAGAAGVVLGDHQKQAFGPTAEQLAQMQASLKGGFDSTRKVLATSTTARAVAGAGAAATWSTIHQKGDEDGTVNPWRVAEHAAIGGAIGAGYHKGEQAMKRLGQFFGKTEEAYGNIAGLREDIHGLGQQIQENPPHAILTMLKKRPAAEDVAQAAAAPAAPDAKATLIGKLQKRFGGNHA